MSTENFIITVFCLIDDELKAFLKGGKLRQRGFQPALTDSEVMTMEVVGEALGHDDDKGFGNILELIGAIFFQVSLKERHL